MLEETDRRLAEIEAALAAFEDQPVAYNPEEVTRAGVFVSIDGAGALRIERGDVRREDEPPAPATDSGSEATGAGLPHEEQKVGAGASDLLRGSGDDAARAEPEEDEGVRPLFNRPLTERTAHRTLALRDALAAQPEVALLAATHALCLRLFYRYTLDTCLELKARCAMFGAQAPGLADTAAAAAVDARRATWQAQLPEDPGALWDALQAFDAGRDRREDGASSPRRSAGRRLGGRSGRCRGHRIT